MKTFPTAIEGAYTIALDLLSDERGYFARTFCDTDFDQLGLSMNVVQSNISVSARRGTLRGMHHQATPHEEVKLVRCTRGTIFDVGLDLREHSPTFKRWFGVELSDSNHLSVYLPKGCAHGLLTMTDDAEVLYLMGDPFVPDASRGVRWDDPAFGIRWPFKPNVISDRDRNYPPYG